MIFSIFLTWYEFAGPQNLCEMDFLRSFKEFPRNPPGILAADWFTGLEERSINTHCAASSLRSDTNTKVFCAAFSLRSDKFYPNFTNWCIFGGVWGTKVNWQKMTTSISLTVYFYQQESLKMVLRKIQTDNSWNTVHVWVCVYL